MHMNTNQKNSKGQIIVIFALALIVLLAATALAVDGSMAYNDRREDQSVADSAALAGAGAAVQLTKDHMPLDFYCGSPLAAHATVAAILAAQNTAASSGVTLIHNDNTNGVTVTCGSDQFRKWLDVKIVVTTDTPTTFARMISRNTLRTRVEATTRVYPKQTLAFGNALATLGNSCGYGVGGIDLKGGSTVTALAGGVFSNSCIVGPNNSSFIMTSGENVAYYGANGFNGTVTGGSLFHSPEQLPPLELPANPCTNTSPTWLTMTSAGTYSPGYYNGITVAKDIHNTDGTVLQPGLYCVKGNIVAQGQSVLTGHKVTIYMMNGNIDFAANATINLTSPDCENPDATCGVPPAIRGILIYFNPAYQRTLSFAPSAESYLEGTILGTTTTVNLIGHADPNAIHSQIVCNNFYANGNTNLTINLNGSETYQNPSSLEMLK
jgi:hypothetical protein